MKQPRASSVLPLVASALLLLGAGRASAVAMHISSDGRQIDIDDPIDLDGEDVVITAPDGSEARISPTGSLRIDGRRITLGEQQRRGLTDYNETVHSIVDRAVVIGIQGASVAFSALGVAIQAIATGDAEHVERRVEAKAQRIKENARRLCIDVRHLRRIQDAVADDLAAFRPFAVIDEDDAERCRVEG